MTSTRGGSHARRLTTGTLAQQTGQAVAVVCSLVVATALGRTLTLSEFGVWGLTLSFVGYLSFVQGSVSSAAVREVSQARSDVAEDRAFTTAVVLYAGVGLLMGLVMVIAGLALLQVFDIPADLEGQARSGVVALGAIIALGWPAQAFRNVLQGRQHFAAVGAAQAGTYVAYASAMLVLILVLEPPLWVLIAVTGFLPVATGLACGAIARGLRIPFRFRVSSLDRAYIRRFSSFSGAMFAMGIADVIIFHLDRAVLALFRPAAVIGLFEAAIRPSTFVRMLQGSLSVTVFPASASFLADRDDTRLRQLVLRGTRYVMAAVTPVCVVFIVFSEPILDVWLGSKFTPAAAAMSILVGTWLVGSAIAIPSSAVIAAGRTRVMIAYAWGVAVLNLALTLALTPSLGLEGVAIGTTGAYVLIFPVIARIVTSILPVTVRELARYSWGPAYVAGVGLAAVLVPARLYFEIDSLGPLLAVSVLGLAAYWIAYSVLWLDSAERRFAWDLLRRKRRDRSATADSSP